MGATGSRRGIASLVEQHYESLYRYAYRLSGASADAEDLTQERFARLRLQLSQLRDPDRAKPWLFSILRNAYLQRAAPIGPTGRYVSTRSAMSLATTPREVPEIGPEQLQVACMNCRKASGRR